MRLFLLLMFLVLPSVANAKVVVDYIFDVKRKGSSIGTHRVTVNQTKDGEKVDVSIDLAVRFAGVTVYRYTHRSVELWTGGVLQKLDSTTDDDGRLFAVTGVRTAEGFSVTTADAAPVILGGTIVPTSYWNKAITSATTVLDSQDGTALKLSASPVPSSYSVNGREVAANLYQLRGSIPIDLWYTQNGTWVGLRFERDGAAITYFLKNNSQLPELLDAQDVAR
ncbi:MAG: DUF6134 family protein [Alphaproteobacteria bacterium]|jgi:hypothetical protein|nr:DUF6134 family protein [Alphaproteobacteria bacterium]